MTFEEKCMNFQKKIDEEQNLFVKCRMAYFLIRKIDEHNEELRLFGLEEKIMNRPKSIYWKK